MNHTISKPKIIVICGQTAAGKTSFAIQLAEYFDGEIIGADSMQIYRYMDIGTAKPTFEERKRIAHHLIDIINPDQDFDAALYAQKAFKIIKQLEAKKKLPFIVGGTGLYLKALINGLFEIKPQKNDSFLRESLKKQASKYGNNFLYDILKEKDPETADKIHLNDTYRIIRAIEFFELTGTKISDQRLKHSFSSQNFDVLKLGLHVERKQLYQRINKRVEDMIQAGLLKEVSLLINSGYSKELKSMKSIGYRQMADFISGNISWKDAVEIIKRDTRRYAKRQMTWFRADPEINWIAPDDTAKARQLISDFLFSSGKSA